MKYTPNMNSTLISVDQLIEDGRNAELCRDIDGFLTIFSDIWTDIEVDPELSQFDKNHQAELFRLIGYFLSYYGKARNLPHYQERSKNLLTKSITLFTQLNETYKTAEAKVMLAGCYFFEGAVEESELILEQTKREFDKNHLHPVYLQICINRLVASLSKKQYQESFEILEEIAIPMEFCEDLRLCTLFHEKSGMAYKYTGQFEKAIFHYNQAIHFAAKSKNNLFLALNKNNLANLYKAVKNYELAHKNESEAIDLAYKYKFIGWLPHFLDTKATIYADEGQLELALETINSAISIFKSGEDANGLTEAMWNKCKFLLYLGRKEEAILFFSELMPIASQQMGEFAVKGFVKEFSDLIHIKQNGSLDDEIKSFKKTEILSAFRNSDYSLHKAADILKIDVLSLANILDNEFPELYKQLDIQPLKAAKQFEIVNDTKQKLSTPRKISQLNLKNTEFNFEGETPQNFSTYFISKEKLTSSFEDIVVSINLDDTSANINDYILVRNPSIDSYSFGKVYQDKLLNLSYILDKDENMPLFLNDHEVVGKAVGYCLFTEIDSNVLNFKKF